MITLKKQKVENTKLGMNGWKAVVHNHGTLSLDEVVTLMALHSTVTRADTLAVISALRDLVAMDLQNGYSVSLGDIGTLQLKVKSKGANTKENWDTGLITSTRVRLVPSSKLKHSIKLGADGMSLRMA